MEIRRMKKSDLNQVVEIEKYAFSMPWSKKSFEDSLKISHTIYCVATEGKEVIGYCGMYCIFEEGNITNVAVKETYRKKGIATNMLDFLMDEAKTKSVSTVMLEVRETNQSAIRLYEKMGFKEVGVRRSFYEQPIEDAVIMWKNDL